MVLKRTFLFHLILVFSLLCAMAQTQAQQLPQNDFWGNVRYGGGLGLGFTNGGFNLALAPSAIYQASPEFASGVGLNLNYTKFNDNRFLAYGASFMNFFNPIPSVQLSAELEQWRVNASQSVINGPDFEENYWTTALFLGIGFTTRNVTVGLRYDVLYDEARSIYIDPLMPFIRVYF